MPGRAAPALLALLAGCLLPVGPWACDPPTTATQLSWREPGLYDALPEAAYAGVADLHETVPPRGLPLVVRPLEARLPTHAVAAATWHPEGRGGPGAPFVSASAPWDAAPGVDVAVGTAAGARADVRRLLDAFLEAVGAARPATDGEVDALLANASRMEHVVHHSARLVLDLAPLQARLDAAPPRISPERGAEWDDWTLWVEYPARTLRFWDDGDAPPRRLHVRPDDVAILTRDDNDLRMHVPEAMAWTNATFARLGLAEPGYERLHVGRWSC